MFEPLTQIHDRTQWLKVKWRADKIEFKTDCELKLSTQKHLDY